MISIAVECPVPGTYLVRDPYQPIPLGKTATDMSVVVYEYGLGFVCHEHGFAGNTSKQDCEHITAAKRKGNQWQKNG